ncbi:LysR family transcriptional regulator [Burkholderia paludis]|uniref:LysR family transcriptional regulator n=1 Tax=Burkholderia paludis TaxID=1506587 RepID=A0A6J5ESA2_9BURK|nr:hypothetical protein LMG30113_05575 [Burkholderia paludis]VWC30258.1 LysR family transcriptional regulator [Burkholderia paludis]
MKQQAKGAHGTLRDGMECRSCDLRPLKVVARCPSHWPGVDVDVKPRVQSGSIGARFVPRHRRARDAPDSLSKPGLRLARVFDYGQVRVAANTHRFANADYATPGQLTDEIQISYRAVRHRQPVPDTADILPRQHGSIETTGIMFRQVASRRIGAWMDALRHGSDIVAITHAAIVRAAVAHELRMDSGAAVRIDVAPLSCMMLVATPHGWTLIHDDVRSNTGA